MKYDATTPPDGTVRDWIDFRADTSPDVVSHIFPDDDSMITWRDLRHECRRIAGQITRLGIEKGTSVAMCQPNGRAAILCLFGILYGGFRATPLNLAAGAVAMGHAIGHSKSALVFLDRSKTDVYAEALERTEARPNVIPVNGTTIGLPDAARDADVALHDVRARDHALLMYTSGTTGLPKGVVHTQSSLLAGGWTTSLAHELSPRDRALCVLPFFHINGLCVTLIAPLVSGGSVVVAQKFSNSRFWRDCTTHEVTWFSVVPTIISHLLQGEADPDPGAKRRIRFGRSASAPLAVETHRSFESRFGIQIIETMGLTETAAQILSNPLAPADRKIGSPGIAIGNEVVILDRKHRKLPRGQSGEIAVRGPNVLLEYLDNTEATASAFTADHWLLTGDLGHQDSDGYVFVTGRQKELIIKGGENIAPREIDEALYSHNDVVEAAAFPRRCATYGQRVEAAVSLCEGSKTTKEELVELCRRQLGLFKCPDEIYLLKELPKGPSGKIQRLKLVEMFESDS